MKAWGWVACLRGLPAQRDSVCMGREGYTSAHVGTPQRRHRHDTSYVKSFGPVSPRGGAGVVRSRCVRTDGRHCTTASVLLGGADPDLPAQDGSPGRCVWKGIPEG